MKETIHLYNHFHYGDIFLSRMLIKGLSEKFNIKFYHNLKHGLFNDLPSVEEVCGVPNNFSLHHTDLKNKIVNTWIGQNNMYYIKNADSIGCSFKNYFRFITDVLNYYGIDINEEEFYLPKIDYEKLVDFSLIKENFLQIKNKFKKCILISNGKVLSGQSFNFDFTSVIDKLSNEHPDYLFLVTENTGLKNPNIVCTYDITKRLPDLLYIGYFATQSDVSIGRASGPYTYYMTHENIIDDSKKIISFNNNSHEGFFYEKHKFNFIWSNNFDLQNVYTIIKNNI